MKRSLWRNRHFAILLSGQWVSQVGNTLGLMAVSWYILSATHSRSDLGYAMGVIGLAGLMGIVAGVFADRWDHRRTLVTTDALRMLLSLLVVVAAIEHDLNVFLVAGALFALNLLGTLFSAAEAAYLPEVTGPEDYGDANGINQSSGALAQLGGLGLGGFLLALGGPVLLFLLNGISFAVSSGSLAFTRPIAPLPKKTAKPASIRADLRQGLNVVRDSVFLRRLIPVAILLNFVAMPLNVMDVAWVRQVLHLGAVAYGIFGVAILVGIVGGSAFGNTLAQWAGFVRSVIAGLTVTGAGIAAMAIFPHFIFNMVCLFAVGVGIGAVNAVVSTRIMVATAPELRGRVAGLLSAFLTVASPLGAAVVGWASGPLGLLWLFRLSGLLIFLLAFGLIGLPDAPEALVSSPVAEMPAES